MILLAFVALALCAASSSWQAPVNPHIEPHSGSSQPTRIDTLPPVHHHQKTLLVRTEAGSSTRKPKQSYRQRAPDVPLPKLEEVASMSLEELVNARPIRSNNEDREHFDLLFANHPEFKKLEPDLQDVRKINIGRVAEKILAMRSDAKASNDSQFTRKLGTEARRYLVAKGVKEDDVKAIEGIVHQEGRINRSARHAQSLTEKQLEEKKEKRRQYEREYKARGGVRQDIPLVDLLGHVDPRKRLTPLQLDAEARKYFGRYTNGHEYTLALKEYMLNYGYTLDDWRAAAGARARAKHNQASARRYIAAVAKEMQDEMQVAVTPSPALLRLHKPRSFIGQKRKKAKDDKQAEQSLQESPGGVSEKRNKTVNLPKDWWKTSNL